MKALSVFLLGIFLFHVVGFAKMFHLLATKAGPNQKTVHYARLQHENDLTITLYGDHQTLSGRGFRKISDSEYLYKGKRYDVVQRKKIVRGVRIQLRQDKLEEGLLAFLKSFFQPTNNMQAPAGHSQKIVKQGLVKSFLPVNATLNIGDKSHHYFILSPCIFPDLIYLLTHCPPPQLG